MVVDSQVYRGIAEGIGGAINEVIYYTKDNRIKSNFPDYFDAGIDYWKKIIASK